VRAGKVGIKIASGAAGSQAGVNARLARTAYEAAQTVMFAAKRVRERQAPREWEIPSVSARSA